MADKILKMLRHAPRRGPWEEADDAWRKAKDFKGSIEKLITYIGNYKIAIFIVMIFAAVSTVFNVVGPKILGKATTALSEGLMKKIAGTGGMDFGLYRKSTSSSSVFISCKCRV